MSSSSETSQKIILAIDFGSRNISFSYFNENPTQVDLSIVSAFSVDSQKVFYSSAALNKKCSISDFTNLKNLSDKLDKQENKKFKEYVKSAEVMMVLLFNHIKEELKKYLSKQNITFRQCVITTRFKCTSHFKNIVGSATEAVGMKCIQFVPDYICNLLYYWYAPFKDGFEPFKTQNITILEVGHTHSTLTHAEIGNTAIEIKYVDSVEVGGKNFIFQLAKKHFKEESVDIDDWKIFSKRNEKSLLEVFKNFSVDNVKVHNLDTEDGTVKFSASLHPFLQEELKGCGCNIDSKLIQINSTSLGCAIAAKRLDCMRTNSYSDQYTFLPKIRTTIKKDQFHIKKHDDNDIKISFPESDEPRSATFEINTSLDKGEYTLHCKDEDEPIGSFEITKSCESDCKYKLTVCLERYLCQNDPNTFYYESIDEKEWYKEPYECSDFVYYHSETSDESNMLEYIRYHRTKIEGVKECINKIKEQTRKLEEILSSKATKQAELKKLMKIQKTEGKQLIRQALQNMNKQTNIDDIEDIYNELMQKIEIREVPPKRSKPESDSDSSEID
ncbi:hypothetical protein QTN25_003633 [Entamoeba marina]